MTPPAHTPRGTPASDTVTLSDRLLHTFFVLSATSLTLILALFAFFLTLILKITAIAPTGRSGRRVKFVERSIVIPPTIPQRKPDNSIESSPALVEAPSPTLSLSLTVTPRELEPRTPDVVEDPLQALVRICGFLAANTARAWRHEELAPTPPLAGLEPYLAAVQEDLETIDQTGKDDEDEDEDSEEEESEGEEEGAAAAEDSEVQVLDQGGKGDSEDLEAGAGEAAGSGSSADAHDRDELGLVLVPDQATHATSPPLPLPPQIPTHPAEPDTSASATTSTPIPTPTPEPTPPSPSPTTQNTSPAEQTDTTPTPTPTPSTSTTRPPTPQPPTMRKRKDAVLRTTRPSGAVLGQLAASDPDHPNENAAAAVDKLADSDDAAVRAAALFSRVADLGTGLFEGTVRERGAALWAALSRSRGRGTPSEVPVPPLTRTHFATSASERS